MNDLFLIAINLTRRCNLACAHCYMDAATREAGSEAELTTDEVKALLDQIRERGDDTMVVLTGGEPLLRRDLEALVAHGNGLGLAMVVGTNGVLLNEKRVAALKAAGAMGMGISLDSLDPNHHDSFRGCPGSWEKTLAGMEFCRQADLPFQVHFSVTEQNADEVQSMIDFTKAAGAHVLNIFFLVCTGRGESMSDITPQRYEQVLQQLVEAQDANKDLLLRARCAPHYKRIAYQHDPESPLTRAQGYEGGGCLAGIHYCRITPEGAVTACPYLEAEEGSIRQESFWQIWDRSPTFQQLRNPQLHGKCGKCEYQKLCGGCRARPVAMGNGLMDTDPWCDYRPEGGGIIQPLIPQLSDEIRWSPEAQQRLSRVPGFLRKMVRKRAETYVREQGETLVTPAHMATLAKNRFKKGMPGRPANVASIAEAGAKSISEAPSLPWTGEAQAYLDQLPPFLQSGVQQVAEDVARSEGRFEVNIKLLQRLESEDAAKRAFPWSEAAEQHLAEALADKAPQVRMFVQPTMEAAAEREVKRRHAQQVELQDVEAVTATLLAGVEWSPEALARVKSAPEFVRAGIKKAAEFGARRDSLAVIGSNDLTRYRNRAMMRAVMRMKGMGMTSLDFDAFAVAKQQVKRLQDNPQAEQRFSKIRDYVEGHQAPDGSGLGTLGHDLIERMKRELKE
ncbi:radical SAM/SPASM domain-containing protein [Candidatus Endoriftia persephonae]|jgi:radical SAM protein with 4Fe4S-binding SPASM domain|uniref:Coenzyme PQQ synthesis protein E n=2 Tax=Gammaproteobacteria TaxID=1236 RepID=G2FCE1_9GAMM|nr:radical SAM protein [Candidatus Endoriftia persephone]EGW55504.1 coenzyme PQQ synthesis protein E [endosymbiont of Tevnia jerichonana (vent Tica)]USF86654.1 radical SAM protein [Candidatus Endoriftia persephone]